MNLNFDYSLYALTIGSLIEITTIRKTEFIDSIYYHHYPTYFFVTSTRDSSGLKNASQGQIIIETNNYLGDVFCQAKECIELI